ncbi:uncharacterized protein LOC124119512 [Haliotis rufescens]|uniref:uncharacterized protein LOC124119512 n=1 Tax=Haliotis rufescens TaxID=6454 RepID=UPI00201ED113|nr:uncharacterized protein LOC124119512 [Haliotis rufescens]
MSTENTTVLMEHLFDDMTSEPTPDTSLERVDTSTETVPGSDSSTCQVLDSNCQQLDNCEDMYMSLISTPARTESSVAIYPHTNQLALTSSYLNAQNSHTSSSLTAHKPKHGKGRRQHRRGSSGTQSRVEDVKHSYKKLEICFAVLCFLNVLMFVFYILTNPKYGPFFSDDKEDDFFETESGQPKTFKLCTKCQPLEAKAGFDLLRDIKSTKYPDHCCFRRVDQLLELIDGYAEIYVDQEVGKVRDEVTFNMTTGMKTGAPANRQVALAHMYYKDTEEERSREVRPLRWETRGVDILLVGSMKMREQKHLQVLHTGYYYIYSHLQLKAGSNAIHQVLKNFEKDTEKKLLYMKPRKNEHVSELQGVFHLDAGDQVTVAATDEAIESGQRKNYFGVFLVGQQ